MLHRGCWKFRPKINGHTHRLADFFVRRKVSLQPFRCFTVSLTVWSVVAGGHQSHFQRVRSSLKPDHISHKLTLQIQHPLMYCTACTHYAASSQQPARPTARLTSAAGTVGLGMRINTISVRSDAAIPLEDPRSRVWTFLAACQSGCQLPLCQLIIMCLLCMLYSGRIKMLTCLWKIRYYSADEQSTTRCRIIIDL